MAASVLQAGPMVQMIFARRTLLLGLSFKHFLEDENRRDVAGYVFASSISNDGERDVAGNVSTAG
jgi:hypothetical protein